jgi:hypothetical protein
MAALLGLLGRGGGSALGGLGAGGALGAGGGGLPQPFGGGYGGGLPGGLPPVAGAAAAGGIPSVGGTGAGTGAGIGPLAPATPTPSLGEQFNLGDIMPASSAAGLGAGTATPFGPSGAGGGFWNSPFGQFLGQRYGMGQQGLGQGGDVMQQLIAALARRRMLG